MDHEYLQNVMGSPYVQEGAFSRLKARGAQAMGALGAMAGHQIQDPNETKLRSLWDGFMSSLKKTMRDWETQISPMFDQKVTLDEDGKEVKETLDALADLLTMQGPQKIGSAPNQGYHEPSVRNPRDNPNTYVKGSAYNRSTTSPTKLTELIDEGFWDAANRDIGLNKALGSNDPIKILNSYKNHVLSAFQKFMRDAVKMTKLTASQIYYKLYHIQPSKPGWQASGNMMKVVQRLTDLQNVGDVGAVPPVIQPQQGQGVPPVIQPQQGQGVPPVIQPQQEPQPPQQPSDEPTKPAQPSGQKPSGDQGIEGGEGDAISPKELPSVILKAIQIIEDAVSQDIAHTGKYFDKDASGQMTPLPKDYGTGQSMTKEAADQPAATDAGGEEPEEKERKGEFIYNFRSKLRKYPGTPFSIQVKPVTVDSKIEGTNISVEVWWQCTDDHNTHNKIYAIANRGGKKSKPMLIMEFFDHEVHSKSGATDPKSTNFFTPEKIINAANPTGPNKLANASPDVLQAIKSHQDKLLRSLMVISARKSMEFKPKKDKTFPLKFDDAGNVTVYKDGKESGTYTSDQVSDFLNKSDFATSEKWKESLDDAGYFEKFPDKEPKEIATYPAFKDAVLALMALKFGEAEATKLAAHAWMELRQTVDDLNAIQTNDIVQLAAKKQKEYGGLESPEGGAAASGNPTAPPAPKAKPPITPVSKPASGPPPTTKPTAPVSGAAGGPPPTTAPTAPVSQEKPEPEKGQGQKPQQPPAPEAKPKKPEQEIKIWKGSDGQMRWSNKKGVVGGLTSKTIQKFKEKPEFLAALKKAKANKFAPPTKKVIDPKTGKETEEPDTNLQEKFVNPFQMDNFLL
jgi:hypothetical protein